MRLGLQEHSCDLYCLQALGLFRQSYGTLDGTTKDNRVFRAICGTSVHIGQRVDTLSHYALLATPQTELRIMLATALAPPCLGTGTSAPQTGWVRLSRVFMGLAEDMGFVNLWRAVETGRRIMSPGLGSGKSGNDRGTQRYNKVTRLADTR